MTVSVSLHVHLAQSTTKFTGIEAGRGLAAVLVVLAHATSIMAEPRFYDRLVWDGMLLRGGAGVDFFFVLSGFIIAWAHFDDIGQPGRLGRYALKRFLRIYPSYWCVLLPLSLLYALFPSAGEPSQHDPINFVFSVTLLPYPEHPILGVAWTLVYEVFFYFVFGCLIWCGRRAATLLLLWGGLVLFAQAFQSLPFPWSVPLNAVSLEFLCGIGAAHLLRHHRVRAPIPLAVSGIFLFVGVMVLMPLLSAYDLLIRGAFGLSASAAIVGIVECERRFSLGVPRPLRILGAASYAIYLVHGVALSFNIQILRRFAPGTLPLFVPLVVLVIGGVTAGIAFHYVVELPLSSYLRVRLLPRPSATLTSGKTA